MAKGLQEARGHEKVVNHSALSHPLLRFTVGSIMILRLRGSSGDHTVPAYSDQRACLRLPLTIRLRFAGPIDMFVKDNREKVSDLPNKRHASPNVFGRSTNSVIATALGELWRHGQG